MENLVSKNVAESEIQKWLDVRKVSDKKRELYSDTISELVTAVEEGRLTVEDDGTLVQKLEFPMGENKSIVTLRFAPRVTIYDVRQATSALNAKANDPDARLIAYIAASTKMAVNVVQRLDTIDYSTSTNIALFFL